MIYSLNEVGKHNKAGDCWVVIDSNVYDVSKFSKFHPGGEKLLLEYGGMDCTSDFYGLHRAQVLKKFEHLKIGQVGKGTNNDNRVTEMVFPYAEGGFWRGLPSPYYQEKHIRFRKAVRSFVDEHIAQIAEECEQFEKPPPADIYKKIGQAGIFAAWLGPGEHLKHVDHLPGGLKPDEIDYFCETIVHQEFARLITPGFGDGLVGGRNISVPPLMHFGTQKMKDTIVPLIVRGEKHSALAITEPFAGSDVRNLRCRAEKSACGKYFIVNGTKKWITEGYDCDYFITCVKTSKKGGRNGLSLLLIENGPGVSTKLIKTVYSSSAKTAYVIFEDVKVPVENLVGEENNGFQAVMFNFNHERWMIVVKMLMRARRIIEESFKYAMQRVVFGKPLINQPIIQEKLAEMASRVESCESFCDSVTFQMSQMSFKEQNEKLGGTIALLKYEAGRVGHVVAEGSVSVFGGRAMTKSGMGSLVERYQRTYRLPGVYGGSSEIMATLAIKQALRSIPKNNNSKL